MRRPDSYASLQPTHSTIVSIINPSYRCLPAASKHTALPRSHLPHQPNPHSGVRGILRAPSPAGSFLGGFRTPTTGVCRAAVAGRHPKPSTTADILRDSRHVSKVRQQLKSPSPLYEVCVSKMRRKPYRSRLAFVAHVRLRSETSARLGSAAIRHASGRRLLGRAVTKYRIVRIKGAGL